MLRFEKESAVFPKIIGRGMAMEPVAQEVFKQRLYELAKENEAKQTQDPPPREAAVTSGDDVLEGMLNDLLGALRREAPMDPLSEEKVAAIATAAEVQAQAACAATAGSEPAESQGVLVDQAPGAADGPEATGPGLLAAVRAAESIMKGDQGRAEPGKS
ncbi:unnamed protein product [Symbiodinium sp. CCMP2456]|nr:unnamed protein product [Symbiodinium sp. CCMP2456]